MTKSANTPASPTLGEHGDAPPGPAEGPDVVPDVEQPPDVPPPSPGAIKDLLEVPVDPGQRVLCVSDLHLRPTRTDASSWAASELVRTLDSLDGPATLVLIGDVLELWFIQPPDGTGSLEAHEDLVRAIARFREEPARRVVYVLGNHDARLAWDGGLLAEVGDRLGCEFAFAVELSGGDGSSGRVRIEHGHAYDPANAFHDPRDPRESPLGMHLVEEILPTCTSWSAGRSREWTRCPTPARSRDSCRRDTSIGASSGSPAGSSSPRVRLPGAHPRLADPDRDRSGGDRAPRRARSAVPRARHDPARVLVAVTLVAVHVARRGWREGSGSGRRTRGTTQNANTRNTAEQLVARGYAGMVAAHTHRCELTEVGTGFYANTGSCTKVIDRVQRDCTCPPSTCRACSSRG